jgi:hypothetical protein
LDFVLVLSKGACLYFGPADLAERHFTSLGFSRPEAKSVPQFLEELSAAPEKFVAMDRQHWGRHIAAASGLKSQRPLALLREREERAKKRRQRMLTGSSLSFVMPSSGTAGTGAHDQGFEGGEQAGTPHWPSAKQVLSLRSHASIAGSDGSRGLGSGSYKQPGFDPDAPGVGGPLPLLPEDIALEDASAHGGTEGGNGSAVNGAVTHAAAGGFAKLSSRQQRVRVWKDLVSGFEQSVFADDVHWVLSHDLTPAPVFRETKASKAARARARKIAAQQAAEARKARAAQAGSAAAEHKSDDESSAGALKGKKSDLAPVPSAGGDIEMGTLPAGTTTTAAAPTAVLVDDQMTAENKAAAANTARAEAMQAKILKGRSGGAPLRKPLPLHTSQVTSFWTQYVENLGRFTVLFYRNQSLWLLNFIKSILIGLMIGTLFYMVSLSQENVRTRFGLFFFMLTYEDIFTSQRIRVAARVSVCCACVLNVHV